VTEPQIILFVLFAGVFALLLWGRWRYDLVAFGALLIGVLAGVVEADSAFAGFGHPATVVVALVLVVSSGLVRSGAVQLITRTVIDASRRLSAHIAIMGGVGAVLSAFMNNVAALALLMPVDMQTAEKAKRSPALTLMPLSFATILGGLATLIGTPPNIIIASYRDETLGAPFAMFDFAPVGGLCAAVGLVFVALVGWRLIPQREEAGTGGRAFEIEEYVAELEVPEDAKVVGKRVHELDEAADEHDVAVIGIVRNGRRLYGSVRRNLIEAGDSLVVEAHPDALEAFRSDLDLEFAASDDDGDDEKPSPAGEGQSLLELVVPDGARIAGKSAMSIGLLWRQNVALLGIARRGRRITKQVRRTTIEPGDILLLLGPSERMGEVANWLGGLPLAERGLSVTQDGKTWLAVAIFAAAIAAASVGLVYLPVALALVVAAYAALGIVPLRELYNEVEWPVVILLGSMIPLGAALDDAGGTALIADGIVGLTGGWPAWAILAVLMVVTMTLSDVLNNTATTIVAAPIAVDLARRLDANPDAFLMAVAVAASCAFLTPIGHKNNTLILGPGGYRFGDYWPMGLPLEGLVLAVGIPAILVFWPL